MPDGIGERLEWQQTGDRSGAEKCQAVQMGTLSKRLGQLAARSFESESSNIIKTASANKRGLSKLLDSTLRTSHDMKVFGLGTAASMANRDRYARFTLSMHAVYHTMERSFDTVPSAAVASVWEPFGEQLRRASALREDAEEVLGPLTVLPPPSAATAAYVTAIEDAARADGADGGGRLLGHLYCRYFADLFGGQALSAPYRYALGLAPTSPRHYDFGPFGADRRASIEAIYEALNAAGETLRDDRARDAVLVETRAAFGHNVAVYSEEGRLVTDGMRGALNMALGFASAKCAPKRA